MIDVFFIKTQLNCYNTKLFKYISELRYFGKTWMIISPSQSTAGHLSQGSPISRHLALSSLKTWMFQYNVWDYNINVKASLSSLLMLSR
jgi:hypothetical protein